jgi:lysozyme family protein
MLDMATLKALNEKRWIECQLHPTPLLQSVAQRLLAGKPRYEPIQAATKVPWPLVAVIHEREASGSWLANIANGDPWNHVTIHVPRGRGPFASWDAAALDALTNCAPYAARNTDWSIGGALTLLEEYNGLGYAELGLPSPYIWASTDQYVKGKYIADGHFDPDVVDTQLGCAAILQQMHRFDTTVQA